MSKRIHPITALENKLALAIMSGDAEKIAAAAKALEAALNATNMPAFIA